MMNALVLADPDARFNSYDEMKKSDAELSSTLASVSKPTSSPRLAFDSCRQRPLGKRADPCTYARCFGGVVSTDLALCGDAPGQLRRPQIQ